MLKYFNDRFNECEINLEKEEESIEILLVSKHDLVSTQEQMKQFKEVQSEFEKNKQSYNVTLEEINDPKISEFVSKQGFQGTLEDRSENITKRRDDVEKKLNECETRYDSQLLIFFGAQKYKKTTFLSAFLQ